MAIIVYVAIRWQDSGLGETLALGAYGLIGVVVAAYIGGAVYEDAKLYPKLVSLQDKQEVINDTIIDERYAEGENNVH
jgi:hypothetical protein